jgi:hypothetical protein
MFKTHQTEIADYALKSPDNMARVLQFVILTIRQPLSRIPGDMALVDKKGAKAHVLWGFKRVAWEHVQAHKAEIYREALELAAIADPSEAERQLVSFFALLPGFGLAKGGFATQLIFGLGGCLDTHNCSRFGLNAQWFKDYKRLKRWAFRYLMLDTYLDYVRKLGGSEALWNSWCEFVATKEPNTYKGPFHVSRLHRDAIIGGSLSDALTYEAA